MNIRTSKLLTTKNPFDGGTSHYATGIHIDLGNNPSIDQLYTAIATQLYDFIMSTNLMDCITVIYTHNYSHMTGKCKDVFTISDLTDYCQYIDNLEN